MRTLFMLLTLLMLTFLGGCTSSIHMSQVDVGSNNSNAPNSDEIINIEQSQKNVLGFVYNTHYVDQAYADLLQRCPKGTTVLNVEYLTNHGFLSWTDKIRIKALCQ